MLKTLKELINSLKNGKKMTPTTNGCATVLTEKHCSKDRTVRLIEKQTANFPELWSAVHVVGNERSLFPGLLSRAKCWQAKDLYSADFVLFTGGFADVSPELYGEKRHLTTNSDPEEDVRDILVFQEAVALGIPMVGVCRGAQFGSVMNGGKLYQHVDQHNKDHEIFIRGANTYIKNVSSVHHQMCRFNEEGGMQIIAEAYEATGKWLNDKDYQSGYTDFDVEAFWYPETAFLGVQGHPEYSGYEEYSLFFIQLIEEYLTTNPQLEVYNGLNRVPRSTIDNRKWKEPETVAKFIMEHS